MDIIDPTDKTVDQLMKLESARGRGRRDQAAIKAKLNTKTTKEERSTRRKRKTKP
jgi:hypothetical protein